MSAARPYSTVQAPQLCLVRPKVYLPYPDVRVLMPDEAVILMTTTVKQYSNKAAFCLGLSLRAWQDQVQ